MQLRPSRVRQSRNAHGARVLGIAVTMVFVLVACSGDDDESAGETPTAVAAATDAAAEDGSEDDTKAADPTAEPTATASEEVVEPTATPVVEDEVEPTPDPTEPPEDLEQDGADPTAQPDEPTAVPSEPPTDGPSYPGCVGTGVAVIEAANAGVALPEHDAGVQAELATYTTDYGALATTNLMCSGGDPFGGPPDASVFVLTNAAGFNVAVYFTNIGPSQWQLAGLVGVGGGA